MLQSTFFRVNVPEVYSRDREAISDCFELTTTENECPKTISKLLLSYESSPSKRKTFAIDPL